MNGDQTPTPSVDAAVASLKERMAEIGMSSEETTAAIDDMRKAYEANRERVFSEPAGGTAARKQRRTDERAAAKVARKALQ